MLGGFLCEVIVYVESMYAVGCWLEGEGRAAKLLLSFMNQKASKGHTKQCVHREQF